jgi:trk system potassium uptake protein TrkH
VLIRPSREDVRIIGYYLGKVMTGVGALMLLPALVAVALREWNDVTALVCGAAVAIGLGALAEWRLRTSRDLTMASGMVTVALAWLVAPAVLSIPLYLSGHYGGFTDAMFDGMSGLTTSGLALIQDLDHLTVPMNLLRHLSHFAGGQGIVVVVLTMLASGGSRVGTLYLGEGRDERIVPNVVRTARFIYFIAGAYLLVGTTALWVTGLVAGLTPGRALFHGINIFMAAFDTGGFAPYSTSMGYYHSPWMEAVVVVLMLAGTLAFGLHYQLWRGRRRALAENLETRSLAVTGIVTVVVCLLGLARAGTFTEPVALVRKGLFTVVSAHSGTGFSVNVPRLFVTDWGAIAPAAIVLAMALGGMASSTAGGFKAIRVGLISKGILRDVRRAVLPDAAVTVAVHRGLTDRRITDGEVRSAITIVVLYMSLHVTGALLGVYFGYAFDEALFESTSALANVGLSVGITEPDMPYAMKLMSILQMWLGRLEFMAAFALVGWVWAAIRGQG